MMLDKFGFQGGFSVWMLGAALLLAPACDSGDDSDEQAEDDGSTGDGDGDGDGDPGDGDGDPGDGDGDREPTGDGDGDTGQLEGCAVHLDAGDCQTAPGCTPVFGQPLVDEGDGAWCTAAADEFIGCVDGSELCPGFAKTLCDGDGYWRTNACVPDNLDVCDPPGDLSGAC
jgi:hypothetical protein